MTTKAAQYIERLDHARCEGNWADVPELVRKVRKHAPDRACLTLAAETECAITQITKVATTHGGAVAMQPPTVEASQQGELSSKIVKLLEAIDNEENHEEDRFQAQVCVGWLHWVFAEYSQALSRLPKQEESQFDAASVTLQWTTISALKATYLRADSLTRNHERTQALATFQAGLPLISNVWSGSRLSSQLRYWSELYMTEFCVLWDVALEDGDVSLQDANALSCYRAWAKYWETVSSSVTGGYGFKGSIPRRKVWENYYLALSQILEEDLPIPTGYVNKITNDLSARNQLRVELKSAEASYQALLLSETTFPRAEEGRPEVEAFVKRVVKNWAIMCGRGWQEQDLGQGGRSSLSRGVLDTLYSAATKTYHSPAILRFLFLLHLSVAEFDLAFRAFDSYMDIVKKVKARVDKTGKPDESLDEDGIVLETISQAIMALCRYGNQQAAEKAHQLGAELEDWLAKLPQLKPSDTSAATTAEEKEKIQMLHPPVPPQIVALAWQAIGLAHAHWSRVTHEATSRTEIQSKAVRCLRRSLSAELGRSKDIRSFFTLGLLLAERRELTAAIDLIKAALISSRGPDEENNVLYGAYWRERSLIPVWNLLALLLSARQDYVMAARACEGALEQFNDPSVLFGTGDSTFRSEHLNDAEKTANSTQAQKGLVDDMDDAEKESILEVKMTQLALVELLEGPEVAVNASFELLTLYSRLFGSQPTQSALNLPKATEPPKTAATHKSIRGSIFGRQPRAATREPSGAQVSDLGSVEPSRPATAQTVASTAPTIQVTEDNGAMANHPRYQRGTSVHRQRSESGRRNSLKKKNRSHSRQRSSSAGEASHKATVVDGEQFFTPSGERDQNDFFTNSSRMPPPISSAFTRSKTLRSLKSQVSMNSKATDQSEPAIEGIYASTNLLPLIQFPKDKEKSQRTAILIKVWLVIAGFYRRAGMYDDCRGAIGEAQKLVQNLDSEATREPSGASGSIKGATWAEEKSVDDLWGDVFTETGLLSQAKSAHYIARSEFEAALTHCPNHPAATVGLSNILLDIYSEELLPPPVLPPLHLHDSWPSSVSDEPSEKTKKDTTKHLPMHPLGLGPSKLQAATKTTTGVSAITETNDTDDQLPAPYKATSLSLIDRLAARDRAYALLSGLTRLGSGWNYSEAWFALARAHEESGQLDKAKEVLWWCVELEEATGLRDWRCLAGGRYVI